MHEALSRKHRGFLAGGASVASAATLDLNAANGAEISGTTTITAVTLAAGRVRWMRATGAFQLTHGASLVLPGAGNYTCAAGDMLCFIAAPSGVVYVLIFKADGTPIVAGAAQASTVEITNESAVAKYISPDRLKSSQRVAKAWVHFAANGTVLDSFNVSSVTYNGAGDYTVNFAAAMPTANYAVVATFDSVAGSHYNYGMISPSGRATGSVRVLGSYAGGFYDAVGAVVVFGD